MSNKLLFNRSFLYLPRMELPLFNFVLPVRLPPCASAIGANSMASRLLCRFPALPRQYMGSYCPRRCARGTSVVKSVPVGLPGCNYPVFPRQRTARSHPRRRAAFGALQALTKAPTGPPAGSGPDRCAKHKGFGRLSSSAGCSKVFLVLFVHNRRCQRGQCKLA